MTKSYWAFSCFLDVTEKVCPAKMLSPIDNISLPHLISDIYNIISLGVANSTADEYTNHVWVKSNGCNSYRRRSYGISTFYTCLVNLNFVDRGKLYHRVLCKQSYILHIKQNSINEKT